MSPKKFHTKVLDVRAEEVSRSIQLAGGRLVHRRRMCTEWFFIPSDKALGQDDGSREMRQWVSLTSGASEECVLSVTAVETWKVGGQSEVKVAVSSGDDVLRILAHLGHEPRTRLDWFGTVYQLGRALLSVDEMPGGHTWLSVEGPEAGSVFETVSVLGFGAEQHSPLSVMEAYRHYGVDMLALDEVTFSCPPEEHA
ncbi:hypothetical protein [Amycolatopsis sp. NPDC059657]|uniref:hypothetical protein n=1 Tax=Amycolatopsis sp. NPDC059657 TaxID=3346899 RepID=UPI00366D97C0